MKTLNRRTVNGNVSCAVPGATRLALRKLSSLTGLLARDGWWTVSEQRSFCALVEAILYELKEPHGTENYEDPISPTPESEAGCP